MLDRIASLASGLWGRIVFAGGVLLAIVTLGWSLRRTGRQEGRIEEREAHREIADEAQRKMDGVRRSDPDDILDRMRRGGI